MASRPHKMSSSDEFLDLLLTGQERANELAEQTNVLLGQLLGRSGAPPTVDGPQVMDIREPHPDPEPAPPAEPEPEPVSIAEPAPEPAPKPARTRKTTGTRALAQRRTTTSKAKGA